MKRFTNGQVTPWLQDRSRENTSPRARKQLVGTNSKEAFLGSNSSRAHQVAPGRLASLKSAEKIFDGDIQISDVPTTVRIYDVAQSNRLDIIAFEPKGRVEFLLSLPVDQLQECFPAKLFDPGCRPLLANALVEAFVYVNTCADEDENTGAVIWAMQADCE